MAGSSPPPSDLPGKTGAKRKTQLRAFQFGRLDQMQRDLFAARKCCANWTLNPTYEEAQVLRFVEHIETLIWKHRHFDDNVRLQREIEQMILPSLQDFKWSVKAYQNGSDTLERWSRLYSAWKRADRRVQEVYGAREDLDL